MRIRNVVRRLWRRVPAGGLLGGGWRRRGLLAASLLVLVGVAVSSASSGVHDTFGSQGSADGQFETPRGVAVNESGAGGVSAGDVYVVDEGNSRVERFDASGGYVAQFGSAGTGPGQFASPRGIAVDQTTGDVYVGEIGNVRVQKFAADGTFLAMWGAGVDQGGGTPANPGDLCTAAHVANGDVCGEGTSGAFGGQFGSPAGVSVASAGSPNAGNVLVADRANRRVAEFTSAGGFVRAFGWDVNAPDGDTAFEVCTVSTDCLAGDGGTEAGQFDSGQPTAVAEDSTGAVYALERLRVQKFSPQAGPPELNPDGAFDTADLTDETGGALPLTDVQVGAAGHVFVMRIVDAGASTCPDGSESIMEERVFEVDTAGALQDTHMACAGIDSLGRFGLNVSSDRLYVSSTAGGSHQVLILDEDVGPPTATATTASDVDANSATLNGIVNPQGTLAGDQVACFFEISADGGATWERLPTTIQVDPGAADVPVSAEKSGLEPNVEYQYRLVAVKAFGNPATTSTPVTFTTDSLPPLVTAAGTTGSEASAILRGRVDPNNEATTYHFEYGLTTAYGTKVPEPDASAGSGGEPVLVQQEITGLQTNTTYHYRLVVNNATGTTTGPDRTFTTGPGLPDNRGYELVSATDKLGNDVMIDGSRTRAAADGSAAQFLSLRAFDDALGTGITTEYMGVRTNDGWKVHSITPLHKPQRLETALFTFDPRYVGEYSADLNTAVYVSRTPLSGASNVLGVQSLYLRQDVRNPGAGSYQLLTDPVTPVIPGPGSASSYFGTSSDFSHVIFESNVGLTLDSPAQPFAAFCASNGFCDHVLYEHAPAGTRLVGQVPVAPDTSCAGAACVVVPRSFPGSTRSTVSYATDTISADGRRIFFTAPPDLFGNAGPLYLREDGTTTLQVNVSEKATPDEPLPALFWNASKDGSKAFFTTTEQLVDEDTNSANDLYRWDRNAPEGQRLTLLSNDEEPGDIPGEVLDVYGASNDGSYVYFTALSQLVAGEQLAQQGDRRMLFSWHDGELAFVGVTSVDDTSYNMPSAWSLSNKASRVTPDGKHFLFVSSSASQPTGDASADCNGLPCRRLYVYSAEANGGNGALSCVSCRPDGAASTANADVVSRVGTGGATSDPHLNRPLSDDGRRVFFSTDEALLPQDHNGNRSDVYMYDLPDDQLQLISRGTGDGSYFLDATPDGSDVFFTTRAKLVGADGDDNIDLYDARVGGGFPEPEPPATPCAGGDACKGTGGLPPSSTSPGSLSFHGPGNTRGHASRTFSIHSLSDRQLRLLAAGSRVALEVRTSGRGRVSVRLTAKLDGRLVPVDRASTIAKRRGVVRVGVRLSQRGLGELRARGRLRLALTVHYGPVAAGKRQSVLLSVSRRSGR